MSEGAGGGACSRAGSAHLSWLGGVPLVAHRVHRARFGVFDGDVAAVEGSKHHLGTSHWDGHGAAVDLAAGDGDRLVVGPCIWAQSDRHSVW